MPAERDSAQQALDCVARREACEWCKHPFKDIYRSGLCRHCYVIKRELRALHHKVEHAKRLTIHTPITQLFKDFPTVALPKGQGKFSRLLPHEDRVISDQEFDFSSRLQPELLTKLLGDRHLIALAYFHVSEYDRFKAGATSILSKSRG